jgi:hypothetical protein
MNEAGSERSFKLEIYLGDEFTQNQFMYASGALVTIHKQDLKPLVVAEGKFLATKSERTR